MHSCMRSSASVHPGTTEWSSVSLPHRIDDDWEVLFHLAGKREHVITAFKLLIWTHNMMEEIPHKAFAVSEHALGTLSPCILCRRSEFAILATPTDVAAQQRYLEQFHHRRIDETVGFEARRTSLTDRVSFTHNYETYILVCRTCGLLCRNPHPSAEAVTEAYIGEEYDQAHLQAEFAAQLAWARGKIPVLARHLSADGSRRLIEVGSFVGGFLTAAREQGWDVMGVDPGDAVARFCRDRHLPVFHGTLEQAPLPSDGVDAVVIWNTFDQLPDPRPTLKTIIHVLKPDGLLIVRIPHGVCYQSAIALVESSHWMRHPVYTGLAWNNLLSFPYLYGYGLTTLDLLMREFGLIRQAAYPDTLMTAAVPGMKWWVTLEERLVKKICQLTTLLALREGDPCLRTATWLDVYYRKPAALSLSWESRLGIAPVCEHEVLYHTIHTETERMHDEARRDKLYS